MGESKHDLFNGIVTRYVGFDPRFLAFARQTRYASLVCMQTLQRDSVAEKDRAFQSDPIHQRAPRVDTRFTVAYISVFDENRSELRCSQKPWLSCVRNREEPSRSQNAKPLFYLCT